MNLCEKFIGKEYGIMGDGGVTFNCTGEGSKIHGYKPHKKLTGGVLTLGKEEKNTKLSEVQLKTQFAS
jgi:hypothetical protein